MQSSMGNKFFVPEMSSFDTCSIPGYSWNWLCTDRAYVAGIPEMLQRFLFVPRSHSRSTTASSQHDVLGQSSFAAVHPRL